MISLRQMAELLGDPRIRDDEAREVLRQFGEYVMAVRGLNARVAAALADLSRQSDLRPLLKDFITAGARLEGRSPAEQIAALTARRNQAFLDLWTLSVGFDPS